MAQPMFDAQALIAMFENAGARQGAQLQQAVTEAMLGALRGRELTLKNIRAALQTVTQAVNAGAERAGMSGLPGAGDPAAMLEKAVAGIDEAMLRTVQANRAALATLTQQGADLRDGPLQKALADLDRMEDTMFSVLKKSAAGAAGPMAGAWGSVLERMQADGTRTGRQATNTVEQFADQMQGMMRTGRQAGLRAAQAMAESYGAMVSGVLLGMSEALQAGGAARDGVAGTGGGNAAPAGDATARKATGGTRARR